MPYNNIFDCHAHYDDSKFDEDRIELFDTMPQNGVVGIINCGIDIETSKLSIDYAKNYAYIYATIGYHPENAHKAPADYLYQLNELLKYKKVLGIGEIGLDYHQVESGKDIQKQRFLEQLDFAKQVKKPVIIHNRDAHGDTMQILKEYKPQGLMHCFSGSVEIMREIVKLGMYISLGGVVTFKNARHTIDVAQKVPLENLILETDAPYLAPVPFRGKRCDSTKISYVAEKIAELRNMDVQELLNITYANAKKFL